MAKKPDGSTKFTELRRVQMELEEARDRYVDLYDGAPTGYLTLNPKGMILEANLPACTLLGINQKDLLGKPVIGFVAAKDQATFLGTFTRFSKQGPGKPGKWISRNRTMPGLGPVRIGGRSG